MGAPPELWAPKYLWPFFCLLCLALDFLKDSTTATPNEWNRFWKVMGRLLPCPGCGIDYAKPETQDLYMRFIGGVSTESKGFFAWMVALRQSIAKRLGRVSRDAEYCKTEMGSTEQAIQKSWKAMHIISFSLPAVISRDLQDDADFVFKQMLPLIFPPGVTDVEKWRSMFPLGWCATKDGFIQTIHKVRVTFTESTVPSIQHILNEWAGEINAYINMMRLKMVKPQNTEASAAQTQAVANSKPLTAINARHQVLGAADALQLKPPPEQHPGAQTVVVAATAVAPQPPMHQVFQQQQPFCGRPPVGKIGGTVQFEERRVVSKEDLRSTASLTYLEMIHPEKREQLMVMAYNHIVRPGTKTNDPPFPEISKPTQLTPQLPQPPQLKKRNKFDPVLGFLFVLLGLLYIALFIHIGWETLLGRASLVQLQQHDLSRTERPSVRSGN